MQDAAVLNPLLASQIPVDARRTEDDGPLLPVAPACLPCNVSYSQRSPLLLSPACCRRHVCSGATSPSALSHMHACREMLSGRRPWAGCHIVVIAMNVAYRGQRPPLAVLSESRCPSKLRALIAACWEHDPARRPAASELVKQLVLVQQQLGER